MLTYCLLGRTQRPLSPFRPCSREFLLQWVIDCNEWLRFTLLSMQKEMDQSSKQKRVIEGKIYCSFWYRWGARWCRDFDFEKVSIIWPARPNCLILIQIIIDYNYSVFLHVLNTDQRIFFYFSRVCSVTLTRHDLYVRLRGKYYQGRNKSTPAFLHSLDASYHLFIN